MSGMSDIMNDTPHPVPMSAPPARWSRLALFALGFAAACLLLAVLAGPGARWGWWHFRTGFDMLRWAVYGGIAASLVSLAAIYHTRPGTPRRGLPAAVLALVVALTLVVVPWLWRVRAQAAPPIHDITTDTGNPPAFVAIAPLRADAPNPVEYGGEDVAAQQQTAYPDIRPLILDMPADAAFQRAFDAARAMGWDIVSADAAAGRIEATDRTFWFGFRDDVVIRLTAAEGRTILDVRSKSRVGRGDAGTNARRVRDYLAEVQRR